jgi:hypothetical protein
MGDEMSVGASKFYRVGCFREVGGFARRVMWDGIDCHRARMLGWTVRSINREELRFLHLRPMGSSEKGILTGRKRLGYGQYAMGTSPMFIVASALYRLPTRPVITGSAAMLWGYFSSVFRREPRYEDPQFRRFLRRFQRLSLVMGKSAAVRKLSEERRPLWEAAHPEAGHQGVPSPEVVPSMSRVSM